MLNSRAVADVNHPIGSISLAPFGEASSCAVDTGSSSRRLVHFLTVEGVDANEVGVNRSSGPTNNSV